jgi:hypothetical protein
VTLCLDVSTECGRAMTVGPPWLQACVEMGLLLSQDNKENGKYRCPWVV